MYVLMVEVAIGGSVRLNTSKMMYANGLDTCINQNAGTGSLCCVLGQDTLPTQCLSTARCINGHEQI